MPGLLDGVNLNDPRAVAALPEWLRRQIVPVSNDENGPQMGFNGMYDQQGRQVVQVPGHTGAGDSSQGDMSLIDPSNYWNDPGFGQVSDAGNVRSVQSASFRNGLRATQLAIAMMAGGGLMGAESLGAAGAESAFAGGAAEGAISGSGLLGASPFAGGVAEGAISGGGLLGGAVPMGQIAVTAPSIAGGGLTAGQVAAGLGVGAGATALSNGANNPPRERINVEAERLPPGGPGLGTAMGVGAGAGLLSGLGGSNPFDGGRAEGDISGEGENPPWYEGLMNNPLQTIGRGLSLYQLGRGLLNQNNNNNNNNNNNGDNEKGGTGEGVTTQPLQRGPWTPNPITAQQIQNFQYARQRGT